MTEQAIPIPPQDPAAIEKRLKARHAAEARFRAYGMIAIGFAGVVLVLLLGSIFSRGIDAFTETQIQIPVTFSEDQIGPIGTTDPAEIRRGNFFGVWRAAVRDYFPEVTNRSEQRALLELIATSAGQDLAQMVIDDPSLIGTTQDVWLLAHTNIDSLYKGLIDRNLPESDRRVKDNQLVWYDRLDAEGRVQSVFHSRFFTQGDSRDPEQAGIRGAIVGSFWTLLITLIVAFPLAVTAAIYLEEFAPKNRVTDLIEVNINNLAAVPSIVFGLLGLAVFLQVAGLPRSAPLVGGLTLALMTLPTIIIATRAALKAVPPSIREAALGLGASPMQAMFHHTLPLAMPGILTGTIIGMAQALGETAPLLMIGMVAFIVDIPGGPLDPASVLPVQVYIWSDSPERAFTSKTSAAIMVLLGFLILMNFLAVVLRKRFERRW